MRPCMIFSLIRAGNPELPGAAGQFIILVRYLSNSNPLARFTCFRFAGGQPFVLQRVQCPKATSHLYLLMNMR